MPPGTRLISDTIRFSPGPVRLEDPKTLCAFADRRGTLLREIERGCRAGARCWGLQPEEASRVLAERFALARPPEIHLGTGLAAVCRPTQAAGAPLAIRVKVDWDAAGAVAMRK